MALGILGGIIAGGLGLFGAKKQADAASDGAAAQAAAAREATALQKEIYYQNRADLQPWRQAGRQAVNRLTDEVLDPYRVVRHDAGTPKKAGDDYWTINGINGSLGRTRRFKSKEEARDVRLAAVGGGELPGNMTTAFQTDPGYRFRVDEATKALERNAAARGLRTSGALMDSINKQVQGQASSEYGNYMNRLFGLSGSGQGAANSTGAFGTNYANNAGQNSLIAGQAAAQGYQGQANAVNQGINNLFSTYGAYQGGFFNPLGG